MHCPFCGAKTTRVIDSRLASDGDQVRRRRSCPSCNERFTTYENAEFTMPIVKKSDHIKEPFSDYKLRGGMLRALEKRPVSNDAINSSIIGIKKKILSSGKKEVKSNWIGERVMDALRELDDVAYIRFASVYHSFNDIGEFIDAIRVMEQSS
ncbi:MAG TPA: transcriptional regulator NrdR [Leucothrix mucor]|uniref:Transcriptional repressor NrdR n=1 Tax=Leucothrix mucor TaxID=45248 RepID=A0A7V2SZP5_LEUMU|nr:transcriptional regulator NrdR [Leucothrix mucor]